MLQSYRCTSSNTERFMAEVLKTNSSNRNEMANIEPSSTRPAWASPKKKGNGNPFYNEMKPLLIGLAVCGKLPLRITKYGECESALRFWPFVYWLLHSTTLSVIACEQLYESATYLTTEGIDFSSTIEHGIIIITIVGLHAGVPFCVVHERDAVISLLNNWRCLIEQMEETIGEKYKPKKMTLLIKILAVIDPFIAIGTVLLERNLFLRGKYWRTLFYVTVFLRSNFQLLLWFFSLYELKQVSLKIEKAISVLSNSTSSSIKMGPSMEDLRKLWLRLSLLAQQTGSAMSLSMGFMSFSLLTVFIVSWFSVISSFVQTDYKHRIDYFMVGPATGLMMLTISEPAHRATEAIGTRIMRALSCIDRNQIPPKLAEEVNTFIQTVSTNYPTITLGGVTVINRTWITSIGATVITYLIVLVQFQASTPSKRK